MVRALSLLLIPLTVLAAPVPAHLMPRTDVQLRHNPNDHPFGNNYEITIRNIGASDLQVWTDRPHGLATFLDCEVVDAKGDRVTRLYPWNSPADRGTPLKLAQTIPARKSFVITLPIFNSVDEKKLTPGTYKVRVHFDYQDQHATSDWLIVDISESQIRTKSLLLGP